MAADIIVKLRTPEFGGSDRPRDKLEELHAQGFHHTRMSYDRNRPADTYIEGWRDKPDDMGPLPWTWAELEGDTAP